MLDMLNPKKPNRFKIKSSEKTTEIILRKYAPCSGGKALGLQNQSDLILKEKSSNIE